MPSRFQNGMCVVCTTCAVHVYGMHTTTHAHTHTQIKMSSTSQKHRNFVGEPMGDKDVTELAGIGPALGGRLSDKGFDKAYVVLGQFLILKKNEELFTEWLNQTCKANAKQQKDCYNCLAEWCDAYL